MRSTMAFTTPDQSNRTPQTIAIGPKPATTPPAMSTKPTTTKAAVMIQKERACLMVLSLSSPPWGRHDPSRTMLTHAIAGPDLASYWRRLGIHATIKTTLLVCTGRVPLGAAPEDERC